MKISKQIIGLLLTTVLLLSCATMAIAAGSNSIKINNAQPNETYRIYKMIDIESYNATTGNYAYKLNSAWEGFFTTGAGKDYITRDSQGYVSWVTSKNTADDMSNLATAAAAQTTGKPEGATAITADSTAQITFSGLDAGYYLITSSQGTKAMIATTPTDKEVVVNEKNPTTVITKQVLEDSTNLWGNQNSGQLGDTIYFSADIAAKKGAKNYVYHDVMDDGLALNLDSIQVTKPNANTPVILTKGTDYTVATNVIHDEDGDDTTTDDRYTSTFEIRFAQSYLDTITADTTLTVTYNAMLNENATPVAGENNNAMLTWGNKSHTEWVPTETKTYKFSVLKYNAADTDTKSPLAGAEFKLYNKTHKDANNKSTAVKLVKLSDTEYRVATPADELNENITVLEKFVTVSSAEITISGVDLDFYELEEIKAPAGYNKLSGRVEVKVLSTNAVKSEIANNTGAVLPATGGMGTTLFYMLGSTLFVGAAILLVTRRRMAR